MSFSQEATSWVARKTILDIVHKHRMEQYPTMIDNSSRNEQQMMSQPDHMVAATPQAAILGKDPEELLRKLIREELHTVNTWVASEIRASKEECLGHLQSIKEILMQSQSKVDAKVQPGTWDMSEPKTLEMSAETSLTQAGQYSKGKNRGEPEVLWADFEEAAHEMDEDHNIYMSILRRLRYQKSVWHHVLEHFDLGYLVVMEEPKECLAKITYSHVFNVLQTTLILVNTGIMSYEADASIKAAVKGDDAPQWLDTCNKAFTMIFSVELAFRIIALRSWFFVAPVDWAWNFFDVFVVASSLVTDFILTGINVSFVRSLRMLRAIRAARIIRALRFFRRLRQMLFSIYSSMSSLIWFFVFLGGVMLMFSIFLLQGLVFAINDLPESRLNSAHVNLEDTPAYQVAQIEKHYGSLGTTLFSLLCAVSGGRDWADLRAPVLPAGEPYETAYVFYCLFVIVGIVNILTGVFVDSSRDAFDESLIVVNEQIQVDNYVKQMMNLFNEMDTDNNGCIDWTSFKKTMSDERMQAYLSSLELEPTHARLIFHLLDAKNDGVITLEDLVMGFMRLKGEAKAIDARSIQRQISLMPKLLKHNAQIDPAAHASG